MPISEAPADVNEPNKPPVVDPAVSEEQRSLEQGIPVSPEETRPPSAPVVRASRALGDPGGYVPVAQVCLRSARGGQNREARQGRVHVHGHAEVSAEDRAEARDQAADDRQTDVGRDKEAGSASPGAAASAAAGAATAACARSAPARSTCPTDPAIAG